MNKDLSHLIQLQSLDVDIKQLQEEIAALPLRQAEMEEQFAASVAEYLAIKAELDETQARKLGLESELEVEQQKLQKFKNDLMKATNEREYTTAVREIDLTRKTIGNLETETLKLMERVEQLELQVNERTPEMEVRRQEVDKLISALRSTVTSDQARIEELMRQRPNILDELSEDARSNYDRLSRMRSGLALAEARDYSCQACRMSLRPQVFNDIRRGETIIMCENCGRILYYPAETAG